jgi:hypothetical protein
VEYSEWAEIKRRFTRRSGKGPRIPSLKQIRKAFGGYDSAVEAASRHFGSSSSEIELTEIQAGVCDELIDERMARAGNRTGDTTIFRASERSG